MTTTSGAIPLVLWSCSAEMPEQDCACAGDGSHPVVRSDRGMHVDTDCACASAEAFPVGMDARAEAFAWQRARELHSYGLSEGWQVVFNPRGPGMVSVVNSSARRILDAFAERSTLCEVKRRLPDIHPNYVQSTARELSNLGLIETQPSSRCADFEPRELIAWLHVTNACNLRCSYCYVAKNRERMTLATAHAAVEAVFRSAAKNAFSAIKLKYAGGEPTLNMPVVQAAHARAQELAKRHGIQLNAVLLTNGVCLQDVVLSFLRSHGVRLMISLDGIGQTHDAERHFADGRGSSDLVMRSLERALECGIRPSLSVTVTGRNAHGVAAAVDLALQHALPFNLNFCRGNSSASDLCAANEELTAALRDVLHRIERRLPRQAVLSSMLDRVALGYPHRYACGAGRNYLVIDHMGMVARCQMDMKAAVTSVWADDPLTQIRSWQGGADFPPVEELDGCRQCLWRYACAGGCRLHDRDGAQCDSRSPYCEVYRTMLPKILRLEGKRLLKWGNGVA